MTVNYADYTDDILKLKVNEAALSLDSMEDMVPYTIEELNARIDEAEAETDSISAEEFFSHFESQRNWQLCR